MKPYLISLVLLLVLVTALGQQNQESGNNARDAKMKKAYELSNQLIRDRLQAEDSSNRDLMQSIAETDLVVIDGSYDHIHLVLEALSLPFVRISREEVAMANFQPHQTVFVNCPGDFPEEAARRLSTFVATGGQLITTDWALRHVLEVAFPGYVEYNEQPTADEVVRIEVMNKEDEVIKGFLDEKTDPVWWLEGSSYPIRILKPDKVKVLIQSRELREKYEENPVLIRFEYGKGIVYHMISHFYLQRTETRQREQNLSATEYYKAKNGGKEMPDKMKEEATDLNYGEMQSANTSSEFIMRAVIKQKQKNQENTLDK